MFQDGRSPTTHAQALSALRGFLGWLADQLERDLPRGAVLASLKMPKRVVLRPYEVLSEAELGELLATAKGHPRDRALLGVLLGAGLRAAETVAQDRGVPSGPIWRAPGGAVRGPVFLAEDRAAQTRGSRRLTPRALGYLVDRRVT